MEDSASQNLIWELGPVFFYTGGSSYILKEGIVS